MERILSYPELYPIGIKYSRVHIGRLEKAGRFPRHVNLGPARVGWLESEILDYIADRIRERDATAPAVA